MRKVSAILLGAGQRGAGAYAAYALRFPNELQFVAVAEPRADRRAAFCEAHRIAPENRFESWEELLERPRMADCCLVCTQDRMHFQPALRALKLGYHVLCEKPMSPNKAEILQLGEAARESKRILSVCHVLRYSPFFLQIKRLMEDGAIGELQCIQHIESVGYWHAVHSFVRGNWRNSEETSPMILAKCCHDMDILRWLADSPCARVSSFGALRHFTPENAPASAPERCTDGCPSRDECPYYAPRFYLSHPSAEAGGFVDALALDHTPEGMLKALAEGPYGRCAYRCDNDVVDHQVVNLFFESGVSASLTMCAFTERCERILNIMGSKGQIQGNMEENEIILHHFASGRTTTIKLQTPSGGHSGSDIAIMRDFVTLVRENNLDSRSSADVSVESHLIALAAEESRLSGGTPIVLEDFKRR